MRRLIFLLLTVLIFTGCSPQSQSQAQTSREAVEAVAVQAPRITVYPGAQTHYLGNIYDYSWEKQYLSEYVMLHFCSAVVNHPEDPYRMEYVRQTFIDADVSIHYIIDRSGTVYCYIPEDRVAWHAGKGRWQDDEKYTDKMNLYSIGIELVGIGSAEDMSLYMSKARYNQLDKSLRGFTDAQYTALAALLEDVCGRNGIPMDRQHIIGHQDYSAQRNDPGQLFDWQRILP
jgi:N-acetyl-anhydromuramyl-L-alanine amidase AmpD